MKIKFFILVLIIFALAGLPFFYIKNLNAKKAGSASDSKVINTESDWTEGQNVNTKLNDPSGSLKIGDATEGAYIATGAGDASYNGTYIESGTYGPQPTYTNGTRWLWYGPVPNDFWNLSEAVGVKGLLCGDYHDCGYFNPSFILGTYNFAPAPYDDQKPAPTVVGSGLATHTTAPTQIDGGENFWQWDSNTITESVPANTSTSYRYRTSADGSTWTSWVGSIGSVTSRTGDDDNNPTRYRYLQIEATLSNTDGTSTPTIDQYDIDYHTEVKPGVPTAQTAVVQ